MVNKKLLGVFATIFTCLLLVDAQSWGGEEVTDGEIIPSEAGFPCHSLPQENYTCGGCIQLHDSCGWCMDFGFNNSPSTPDVTPIKTYWSMAVLQTKLRRIAKCAAEPQEVEIRIRPKSKARFDVTFRQAVDYPVDLYYLMDLSYSMKDDKEKLSQLGDMLVILSFIE
uniref:Integrin beta subunit VWA domain-containing protein n=1 Tax=Ditylenchus dipsaci TaxID=166011 RepID=A0A915EPY7_9BILA